MSRPSKLSDRQWEEIARRLADGERVTDLAKKFGVSKTAISSRVSKQLRNIKDVANQMVAADLALSKLAVSEQNLAVSIAQKMRAISDNLADAAVNGSINARRLSEMAGLQVSKINPDDLTGSADTLKGMMMLTRLANESASLGLDLISSTKEMVREESAEPAAVVAEYTLKPDEDVPAKPIL